MNHSSGTLLAERFRIEEQLGAGAFGVVWRATDLQNNLTVAVKVLKQPTPESQRRFALETRSLQALRHPNCVELLDHGVDGDSHYLILQYVAGDPLGRWMRSNPTETDKIDVATQLVTGVLAAHRAGILHRDLKPDNVIVTPTATGLHVTILDFGIARLAGAHPSDITKTGVLNGTPGYMSPEQLRARNVATPSDIYALGVIFFEMFEGRPPFDAGSPMATALEHVSRPPPPARDAPRHIAALIDQMLSKEADARPTAAVVLRGLAGDPSAGQRQPAEHVNNTLFAAVAVGLLIAVGAAAWAAWWLRSAEPPPRQPSSIRSDGTALTKAAPELVKPTTSDAGVTDTPDDGAEVERGVVVLEQSEKFSLWAYIPQSYDPANPPPAVWILHDAGHSARAMLDYPDYQRLSEESGRVLIASDDSSTATHVWKTADEPRLLSQVRDIGKHIAVDPDERYLVAHGSGGDVATTLSCKIPFRAIALPSYRADTASSFCTENPVPTLLIAGLNDSSAPLSGRSPCLTNISMKGAQILSLDEHLKAYRTAHHCRGSAKRLDDDCETWSCGTELVSCRVPGGRYLPGVPIDAGLLTPLFKQCGESLKTSPMDKIWQFFDKHAPERSAK